MITCRTRGPDPFNPVWHGDRAPMLVEVGFGFRSFAISMRLLFVKILCFEVIGVDIFSLPWYFMQEFSGKKSRLCSDIFVREVGGGC